MNIRTEVRCSECDKVIGYVEGGYPVPYIICPECKEAWDEYETQREPNRSK